MKGQCFILENTMDNFWQTLNLNRVQVQKLLLEWSSYCAILFFGKKRMPKSAPDAPHSPMKGMFSIFSWIPHNPYGSHQESAEVCQTESRHLNKNSHSRADTDKVLLVCNQNPQYLEIMTWQDSVPESAGASSYLSRKPPGKIFFEEIAVHGGGKKRNNLILSSLLGKYTVKSKACQLATKKPSWADALKWNSACLSSYRVHLSTAHLLWGLRVFISV